MESVGIQRAAAPLGEAFALSRPVHGLSNGRITIALGSFDALVSRGLTQILRESQNLQIIGPDLDDRALELTVKQIAPRIAMLDERAAAAPSVLDRLQSSQPGIGIIVLAHQPALADGMRLFARGASCLSKALSAADILAAVRIVADGRRVFAPGDGHLVERGYPDRAASLTPREAEVLEYLSRGRTQHEVAQAMDVGYETIRTHSAHIRRKLGVRRNRDLIGI
jgi:DNA-binding NarL/FixJ family response regulator